MDLFEICVHGYDSLLASSLRDNPVYHLLVGSSLPDDGFWTTSDLQRRSGRRFMFQKLATAGDCAQQAGVPKLLRFREFGTRSDQVWFMNDPAQSKTDWAGVLGSQNWTDAGD